MGKVIAADQQVARHADVGPLRRIRDILAQALADSSDLSKFSGRVSDSGEGRWTVSAAIEQGTPAPVLSAALFQRFASRGEDEFAAKMLSAMRYHFGGHEEKK